MIDRIMVSLNLMFWTFIMIYFLLKLFLFLEKDTRIAFNEISYHHVINCMKIRFINSNINLEVQYKC